MFKGHKSDQDKNKKAIAEKKIKERTEALREAAQNCLATDSFKKYLEEYESATEDMVNIMIDTKLDDPVQDAFFLRSVLSKISVSRALIRSVRKDAKR